MNEFQVLDIGFSEDRRAEPECPQQNRVASSSCRFWIGDFHPKTDIGMRLERRKYRFIWI